MVVATGAAKRQAEHRTSVVTTSSRFRRIRGLKFRFRQLRRERTGSDKTGRHHRQRVVWCQFIASKLPADELVVRHIGVQRPDKGTASGCPGSVVVLLVPKCDFRKEQMSIQQPGPAFAVMLRIEQPVNHRSESHLLVLSLAAMKVSTSSGDGGRPIGSKQTRRESASGISQRVRRYPVSFLFHGSDELIDLTRHQAVPLILLAELACRLE